MSPLLLSVGFCNADETLSGYGAADITWHLQELNGTAFAATANLTFPEMGKIVGEGPCNAFTGDQTAPYPWFRVEQVASTRRACPELAEENALFDALSKMTQAEVSATTLILSNDEGGKMIFSTKTQTE